MIFRDLFKSGLRMANDNAPALFTAFGTVGVVTTAVLTGRASFEAAKKIASHESAANAKREAGTGRVELSKTEKLALVWPLYIGAVTSGAVTCAAVILSHRVSSKRAAALAAAYAMSEGRLEEYQDKVKEKFGIKKEKEARDEIAHEKVQRDYDEGSVIFSPTAGKVLIRDDYSGRYFWSTKEKVDQAVNETNREVLMNFSGSQSVSDFYDRLELEHVSTSDDFGWNSNEMCEIEWSTTTTPDGSIPVHSFEFVNRPILNPGASSSFR